MAQDCCSNLQFALHASALHASRPCRMTATSQKMFAVAMMLLVAGCLGSSCRPQDSKASEDTSMLSLQAARANMTRTGWAKDTTSDGKCKQWGSASQRSKFVGPGKPYPGLVRVRFFPYHYTITENQPVLEECVTQGHDKTELTFHVGRKNSKPPLEDFMAGIGSDYVADTELSSHDTPTELNFAFEGVLSFEFEDYTTHSVTIPNWPVWEEHYQSSGAFQLLDTGWPGMFSPKSADLQKRGGKGHSLRARVRAPLPLLTFLGTEEGFTPPPTTSSFATISRFLIRASMIPHERIHGHFRGFHHQLCLRTPVRVLPL